MNGKSLSFVYMATYGKFRALPAIFLLVVFFMLPTQVSAMPLIKKGDKEVNFRTLIVPAIDHVYAKLMSQYREVKILTDAGKSSVLIEQLKHQYRVTSNSALLMALKPHPRSIAIAQAALESSWATSRFFKEANNLFGIWSFSKNEPRIAALKKRDGETVWVKKYNSVEQAIYDYYLIIGRSAAFAEFRQARMETDDPFILVKKLNRYSELGQKYTKALASIIRNNKFDEYDRN